ncbi:hypothetical protein KFE25_002787 [Diacronema lutheri]|uniref:Uncharacterized protein n=1 Tax=Diacronema lutheri TaxID=2081491 RepID=A0A8J5XNT4_DIALT|nr:hypothetical protein KFE25_002787 [Diacronema lutheri]
MVQHVAITYGDNQAALAEEREYARSPLLFAIRVKAHRTRVKLCARFLDARRRFLSTTHGQRLAAAWMAAWLWWMRITRRALPKEIVVAWSIAEVKAEATRRQLDISACIERAEIEQMLVAKDASQERGAGLRAGDPDLDDMPV